MSLETSYPQSQVFGRHAPAFALTQHVAGGGGTARDRM